MEDVLPKLAICEVLSRLPVKTIIRYKCVCKEWRDLASDPYFVRLHLSRSSRDAGLMILTRYKPSRQGILKWVEIGHNPYNPLVNMKRLDLRGTCTCAAGYLISQVGSVNGLICSVYHPGWVFIYNPVLEEFMGLTLPTQDLEPLCYGFGVSTAGEYKVVRISHKKTSLKDSKEVTAVEIEVYTLGTGQWRSLGQTPVRLHSKHGPMDTNGVFVNSHVYWLIGDRIFEFDLTTETFKLFPSPPEGNYRESRKMLGVRKGRLTRVSWSSSGLEVWVLVKGGKSWYREIIIPKKINHLHDHEPLCLLDGLKGTSYSILILCKSVCLKHPKQVMAHCLDTNMIVPLNLKICSDPIMSYRPSFVKLSNFGSEFVDVMYDDEESRKQYVCGRWLGS